MKYNVVSEDEKRWRLQEDVRLIRNFSALKADKKRYEAAKEQIDKEIKEYEKILKNK